MTVLNWIIRAATTNDFYDRAKHLSDELIPPRKKNIDSKDYKDDLSSALESLYDPVGQPVIQWLRAE